MEARDEVERTRGRSRFGSALAAVCVVVAAIGAYVSAGLDGPYLFDDLQAIEGNAALDSLGTALDTPRNTSVAGRPVVQLSFALDVLRAGGERSAASMRATNLGLHALAALLVLALLRRVLPAGAALAAAVLWAAHPLASECVLYVVQRTELLASLFYLLTVWAALRSSEASRPGPWEALAVGACTLGLLCKESVVTAPVAVLLVDRTLVAGSFREALARRARLYAGLAATWIVLGFVLAGAPRDNTVSLALGPSSLDYLFAQGEVLALYLARAIWPVGLVLDFGPLRGFDTTAATIGWALVLPLALATLWALRVRPRVGLAGAWFFLLLAPTSSFVPILSEVGAERRVYLPLVGLVALVVGFLAPRLPRVPALGLTGLVALAFAFATHVRCGEYASAESMWRTVVERRPTNARGHANLAHELGSLGRRAEALAGYREALRIDPLDGKSHANLGALIAMSGRPGEALEHLRRGVELVPDDVAARTNLSRALVQAGAPGEALPHIEEAVRLAPDAAPIHNVRGVALLGVGRHADSADAFLAALELDPAHSDARGNLVRCLVVKGRTSRAAGEDGAAAIELAREAVRRTGERDAELLEALAQVLDLFGHADEAVATMRRAIALAEAEGRTRLALQWRQRIGDPHPGERR